MSVTRELIDAIASGKSQDIDRTFTETFSNKVSDAIQTMRDNIAQNLFSTPKAE